MKRRSIVFQRVGAILMFVTPVFCQIQATQPEFEVADVKSNKSGEVRPAVDLLPGGKLSMQNVPMRMLIMFAYHVRADAISGGPGWMGSERFDVIAKASDKASPDDLRLMLRKLLADRFQLVVHTEEKLMPGFALLPGKPSPHLHPSEEAILREQRCIPGTAAPGQKHVECHHLTMAGLAEWLQELAPLDFPVPVKDETHLQGAFDFYLDWTPTVRQTGAPPAEQMGPNIFDAVAVQLGLKLESKKLLLPVIMIDGVERPSEN